EELNTLPYGLIILDNKGKVLFYNETESRLTGFRKARVEGRNFFQEIAPCTRVKAFEGRFKRFVRGELGPVVFFEFVFRFERGAQHVTIGFSRGRRRGTINVMMRRRTM
ncbi:MAG: PAS domain-containing protein, partial [Myxococcota bacterium]